MPLSYEKALRLHARHRTTAEEDLDLANLEAVKEAAKAKVGVVKQTGSKSVAKPEASAKRAVTPHRRPKLSHAKTAEATVLPKAGKPPVRPKRDTGPRRKTEAAKNPQQESPYSRLPSAARSQGADWDRDQYHPTTRSASLELDTWNPTSGLEGSGQRIELSPELDQRRTIVSVRLTEGEFARLRDRAGESGITVSAYMRSCVMEADQLRSQVKRALAEMRSLGAKPHVDRFPSIVSAGNATANHSSGWFQLLVRTATVFFSPLFPGRRGTSLARTDPEMRL